MHLSPLQTIFSVFSPEGRGVFFFIFLIRGFIVILLLLLLFSFFFLFFVVYFVRLVCPVIFLLIGVSSCVPSLVFFFCNLGVCSLGVLYIICESVVIKKNVRKK